MDKIVKRLKYFNEKFPRKELEMAIKNRDVITPVLLGTLDEVLEHREIVVENEDYMLHLYALYLLAQFREKKAFPKIIELISFTSEELDIILGDVISEGLPSILYSTYDGQISLLKKTIENPLINRFARSGVLDVYAKLYSDGILSREDFIEYLRKIIYKLPYDYNSDLATDVLGVVIEYHIFEMIDDIQFLYDEYRIETIVYGEYDNFIDLIYSYKYDGGSVKYIDDAINEMEWWSCFEESVEERRKREKALEKLERQMLKEMCLESKRRKREKIGRNDPCPCGSGKKYKRCCIDKDLKDPLKLADAREGWLKDYPVEKGERKEGEILISDMFDSEAINIDKLVYLALHRRAIPIWVKRDKLAENKNKIMYLTEAFERFLSKCKKEEINTFEKYDENHKIHYKSEEWVKKFKELLDESSYEVEYNNTFKKVEEVLSRFS